MSEHQTVQEHYNEQQLRAFYNAGLLRQKLNQFDMEEIDEILNEKERKSFVLNSPDPFDPT